MRVTKNREGEITHIDREPVLAKFKEKVQDYGYVGNCKNLYELGPRLMVTEGIQNQLDIANEIIASAIIIKQACEKALREQQ